MSIGLAGDQARLERMHSEHLLAFPANLQLLLFIHMAVHDGNGTENTDELPILQLRCPKLCHPKVRGSHRVGTCLRGDNGKVIVARWERCHREALPNNCVYVSRAILHPGIKPG